jgi:E3 ubiquitin-protein ligase MYCBP2
MLVRPNADGSFSANWTPSAAGLYSIHVTIDGYPFDEVYKVDVKEPPQGVLPPSHNITVRNNSSPSHRLRQFRTRASAGLRVRAQPSLQGEQIGIVACEGTISFIEEVLESRRCCILIFYQYPHCIPFFYSCVMTTELGCD